MDEYLNNGAAQRDELGTLPDQVQTSLAEHRDLYRRDPEAAHFWDPIVIGVEGGPVKTLLLTYTGRKTGRSLDTALQYFELDGALAIVASRGGTIDHPEWFKNLEHQPRCRVQVGRFGSAARARVADQEERARWWPLIVKEQPVQAVYASRTSREIPVVILDTGEMRPTAG